MADHGVGHIRRFIEGLYRSGLRADEIRRLSWNTAQPIAIDATDQMPLIRITTSGQKARRESWEPILPDFWTLCCQTPEPERIGHVFPLPNGHGGQMAKSTIERIVADCGRRAGVIVDPESGKCASAHDLRRSFCGLLIDAGLSRSEVQRWMRHRDYRTTDRYYFRRTSRQIGEKVWSSVLGGALGGAPQDDDQAEN